MQDYHHLFPYITPSEVILQCHKFNMHLLKITKISEVGRHGHEESDRTNLETSHPNMLVNDVTMLKQCIMQSDIIVLVVVIILKIEVTSCQNTIYFDIDCRLSWLNVIFNLTNLATCKTEELKK